MRKILSLLLCVILTIGLTACKKELVFNEMKTSRANLPTNQATVLIDMQGGLPFMVYAQRTRQGIVVTTDVCLAHMGKVTTHGHPCSKNDHRNRCELQPIDWTQDALWIIITPEAVEAVFDVWSSVRN
jgi:hypothetical protein